MAAPYPDQHAYPPQPYQQFPKGGYQPAPAQLPSQQGKPFPVQGPPHGYDYGAQPGYQPIPAPAPVTATSTNVVMTAQPTPVTTIYQAPTKQDYSGMAVGALVFSVITLLCCGSLLSLTCSIPALILAIVAFRTTGSSQKSKAGISIALNVTAVICTVLLLVIVIPVYVVNVVHVVNAGRYCSSYYSSTYDTLCIPDSYTTCRYCPCTFYSSTGRYCPSRYS